MNRTHHTDTDAFSERDAAWFEELADAVGNARAAQLARQPGGCAFDGFFPQTPPSVNDIAMSLIAMTDAGQRGTSFECETAARRLRSEAHALATHETAMMLIAMHRSGHASRAACGAVLFEGVNRLLDAQNRDGGWCATVGNLKRDTSCPAVTARVLEALGAFGFRVGQRPVDAATKFLFANQDESGAWIARADANPLFGTRDVLAGLLAIGFDVTLPVARRAVRWLKESQNADGGWGDNGNSDPTSTACAILGLLTAGEAESAEVRAGAEFLVGTQRAGGCWKDAPYYPLMALARYASAVGVALVRRDAGHASPAPKTLSTRIFADH